MCVKFIPIHWIKLKENYKVQRGSEWPLIASGLQTPTLLVFFNET